MILTANEIKQVRHFMIDADITPKGLAQAVGLKYATVAYILRGGYKGPAARKVVEFVRADVAHVVERMTCNHQGAGSTPAIGS